jgi:hypothetical protein
MLNDALREGRVLDRLAELLEEDGVKLLSHNGMAELLRPAVQSDKCGGRNRRKGHRKHRRHATRVANAGATPGSMRRAQR